MFQRKLGRNLAERSLRGVVAAVLPSLGEDLLRPCNSDVLASDACESGIAVCVGTFPGWQLACAIEVSSSPAETVASARAGTLDGASQDVGQDLGPSGHSSGVVSVISQGPAKSSWSGPAWRY